MDKPDLPRVVENGGATLLFPNPYDVEDVIRGIRKGTVMSVGQIRRRLAKQSNADAACPLVTGIFVRIAAEAAEEDARAGLKRIAPYWRVVKEDGGLNPKFPGGVEQQADRLRAEGVTVLPGEGKKAPRVCV